MQKSEKIICRKALQKDFKGICQLRAESANDPVEKLTTEYAAYNPKIDHPWIQKCLRARQKMILIAEDKEGICAYSILAIETVPKKNQKYFTYRKKSVLAHLYVTSQKRHQGIGEKLLAYTLEFSKKQGVDFIELDCYIGNTKADKLYKKLGFKDIFVRKRFKIK